MAFEKKPFLIILSAPSGGGKTTILRAILQLMNNIDYSVSYTTRRPRGTEVNHVDYHFVSREEFERRIAAGDFLEHARFSDNLYGTSISFIQSRLDQGRHVIMDIEILGANQISNTQIPYVKIFILPPSLDVLKERLIKRHTDSLTEIEKRLNIARDEIKHIPEYDYLVINDDLELAVQSVRQIILSEENRTCRYHNPNRDFLIEGDTHD